MQRQEAAFLRVTSGLWEVLVQASGDTAVALLECIGGFSKKLRDGIRSELLLSVSKQRVKGLS